MGAIDKFRAVFGDMAIRSVHHNVARLDAARAFLKSENWPPNDVMDFVRSTRTTELVRDRRNIERQTPTLVAHGPGK